MMKTVLPALFANLLCILCNAQWTPQTSNTSNNISCVYFTSADTGLAFAAQWLKTSNGGQTWSGSPAIYGCSSLQMLSPLVGYASGGSMDVIRTIDGGQTWTISLNDTNYILSVHFPTPMVGYAVGFDGFNYFGAVYKTTDGGNTWNILANPAIDIINDVFFVNADTGWIVGFDGMGDFIYKTVDGGANWITQTPVGNGMIWAITCTTPDSCWCAGNSGGQISRTINGGNSWLPCTNPQTNPLYDIQFVNGSTGYAAGGTGFGSGHIVKSINGGQTWTLDLSTTSTFNGIHFPTSTIGYAVGTGGAIYKHDPSASVPDFISGIMVDLFPNPATVQININCNQQVENVKLLNLAGKVLLNFIANSGTFTIPLTDISPGVYLLEINTHAGVERERLVILEK